MVCIRVALHVQLWAMDIFQDARRSESRQSTKMISIRIEKKESRGRRGRGEGIDLRKDPLNGEGGVVGEVEFGGDVLQVDFHFFAAERVELLNVRSCPSIAIHHLF